MVAVSAIAVRVAVLSIFAPPQATISDGKTVRRVEARKDVLHVDGAPKQVLRVEGPGVTVAIPKLTRRFPGAVEARARAGVVELIVDVPDEEYLPGTVALEARGEHPEALMTQAIVARTFVARGSRHVGSGHHLCDLTHCQTWRGLDGETEKARVAVRATEGQVLRHGAQVADVYFSAVCGGATADVTDVWGGEPRPYLRSVPCDACRGAPEYRWTATVPRVVVVDRAADGTARTLRDGSRAITAEQYRVNMGRSSGWNVVKSNAFVVVDGRRLEGRGFGHRVGLCVAGAAELARRGLDHKAILARYFPGTTLGQR